MRATKNSLMLSTNQLSLDLPAIVTTPVTEGPKPSESNAAFGHRSVPTRAGSAVKARLLSGCFAPPSILHKQLNEWRDGNLTTTGAEEIRLKKRVTKLLKKAHKRKSTELVIRSPTESQSSRWPGLTSLPECMTSFENLTSLTIEDEDHYRYSWRYHAAISNLPPNLRTLAIYGIGVKRLLTLPANLTSLKIGGTEIAELPILPETLTDLELYLPELTKLPKLPPGLLNLRISDNKLQYLPMLPDTLIGLYAQRSNLHSLPALPITLKSLDVSNNNLTYLPFLPRGLEELYINYNAFDDGKVQSLDYRAHAPFIVPDKNIEAGKKASSKCKAWQLTAPTTVLSQDCSEPQSLDANILARINFDKQLMDWVEGPGERSTADEPRPGVQMRRDLAEKVYKSTDWFSPNLEEISIYIQERMPNFIHLIPQISAIRLTNHIAPPLKIYEELKWPPNLRALDIRDLDNADPEWRLPRLPKKFVLLEAPKGYVVREITRLQQDCKDAVVRPFTDTQNLGSLGRLPTDISEKILDLIALDVKSLTNLSATNSFVNTGLQSRFTVAIATSKIKILKQYCWWRD